MTTKIICNFNIAMFKDNFFLLCLKRFILPCIFLKKRFNTFTLPNKSVICHVSDKTLNVNLTLMQRQWFTGKCCVGRLDGKLSLSLFEMVKVGYVTVVFAWLSAPHSPLDILTVSLCVCVCVFTSRNRKTGMFLRAAVTGPDKIERYVGTEREGELRERKSADL